MPLAEKAIPDDLAIPEAAALRGKGIPYHDEQEPPAYTQPKSDIMAIDTIPNP